jgi:predicted TIM-barrel fold metal-dependent hydrolase
MAGINRTVLFPAFHSDYAVANREVARIVASRPDRFYGFAFVHPDRDRGRVFAMVKVAVEQYGFRGIKVHRYDGRITREICEAARAFSLPVLYDVMGEVSVVELLAREYPDVVFIIPHLGSFADDWRAQLALIDHLVRHPNIYTDTSAVRRFDLLQDAVRRAGARKVLFGSDGPWLHPGVELVKVRVLGLPQYEEQLILSGNFLRLIAGVRSRPKPYAIAAVAAAWTPGEFRDPWAGPQFPTG